MHTSKGFAAECSATLANGVRLKSGFGNVKNLTCFWIASKSNKVKMGTTEPNIPDERKQQAQIEEETEDRELAKGNVTFPATFPTMQFQKFF